MKVPNLFRLGSAIEYPRTTHSPLIEGLKHLYSTDEMGNAGGFVLPMQGKMVGFYFLCIASDGMDWEHVSVTVLGQPRCPTWEEMCYIKSVFWDEDQAVMQLHPPKEDWVNNHPYCLHLWRPMKAQIPLPAKIMVGIKQLDTLKNNTSL